jgi:hypothetical protein
MKTSDKVLLALVGLVACLAGLASAIALMVLL